MRVTTESATAFNRVDVVATQDPSHATEDERDRTRRNPRAEAICPAPLRFLISDVAIVALGIFESCLLYTSDAADE